MRVMMVILLILVVTIPHLLAVEGMPDPPVDHTKKNIAALRWCLAALTLQIMKLVEVVNREDVSWEMKAQVKETLEVCKTIMDQLGFYAKDE